MIKNTWSYIELSVYKEMLVQLIQLFTTTSNDRQPRTTTTKNTDDDGECIANKKQLTRLALMARRVISAAKAWMRMYAQLLIAYRGEYSHVSSPDPY
jgi:hypothetical protein